MRGLVFLGWLVLLVFLLWPVLKWILRQRFARVGGAGRGPGPRALRDELVKDPVCQTYVVRSRALTKSAGGSTYYFCSPECAARFAGEKRG